MEIVGIAEEEEDAEAVIVKKAKAIEGVISLKMENVEERNSKERRKAREAVSLVNCLTDLTTSDVHMELSLPDTIAQ